MNKFFVSLQKYCHLIVTAELVLSTSIMARAQTTPHVWQVPDPLYQPLLSDGSPGLSREGVLMWGFNISHQGVLRQTARRMGVDCSLLDMHHQTGQYQNRSRSGGTPLLLFKNSKEENSL